ncbi:hypothetical protein BMT55_06825 [Listeria newyorkensis]|uniref:Quinate/shikimate 5-dehydrogenase/glutamyl-tRNA reductase domain-containing protein n=2 Tax=Listeria newyorkensis TaxID=1497681 RepID=A0ABX4XMB6_9LIST|nr:MULTISPECIES: hypothetical protein [Listeria]KGL42265.1 hypothetical protein EP56_08595 [Listeriaceae bacterium FSL A5-0209]KGL38695.1 hypothetical protein EP58_14770 [Listeria newyorkensis]PNP92668.1 hypothetical protein BMT55_06825 [Listeria newyorkensis]RQW66465.1 hypothetical protein DUK53_10070 [Listeria sp. SHR_NRA_18]SQC56920.1 dipicolinate synthase subunit A [Listeria newyorkensis]
MEALIRLKQKNLADYEYMILTSTANKTNTNQLLPDRLSSEGSILNIQVSTDVFAIAVLRLVDGVIPHIFVDVERKQAINLWEIASEMCHDSAIHPLKANDVTVDAAASIVINELQNNFEQCRVMIYGTGNLATKTALKLAELGMHVTLAGRNVSKVTRIVHVLNDILPSHTPLPIQVFQANRTDKVDVLISAISAQKVLDETWLNYLQPDGFALDMGLNNFSEQFIDKILLSERALYRVDIQAKIGTAILDLKTEDYFFSKIRGKIKWLDHTAVAGGIIGNENDVVLNRVTPPYVVIGTSNGTGGLK